MLTFNRILVACQHNILHVDISLQVRIIMLHVFKNKSDVNIIMLRDDIIYLACRGQKYATILSVASIIVKTYPFC